MDKIYLWIRISNNYDEIQIKQIYKCYSPCLQNERNYWPEIDRRLVTIMDKDNIIIDKLRKFVKKEGDMFGGNKRIRKQIRTLIKIPEQKSRSISPDIIKDFKPGPEIPQNRDACCNVI